MRDSARQDIIYGVEVDIMLQKDQRSRRLTRGMDLWL